MRALFSRDSNLKVPGFAQSRVSPEVSLQLFTFKLWKRNVLALWIDNNDPNLLLTRIRGIQNYRYLTCASAWALTYIFLLQRNPWDYRYIMYIGSLFIFWALFPLHLVYLYFSVFLKKKYSWNMLSQSSDASSSYPTSIELQQPTLILLNSLLTSVTTALERAAEEKSLLLNKVKFKNKLVSVSSSCYFGLHCQLFNIDV